MRCKTLCPGFGTRAALDVALLRCPILRAGILSVSQHNSYYFGNLPEVNVKKSWRTLPPQKSGQIKPRFCGHFILPLTRHYNREVDGANVTEKKFYTLGSSTVAVRTVQGSTDTLNWILSDHLGSASVTANVDGSLNSELRYTAFGEVRYNNGLTPTEYRYTGQLEQASINLLSIFTRKCTTHIHQQCTSNLRQHYATFKTGQCAKQIDC